MKVNDKRGEDLNDYIKRLTERAIAWKFVESAPSDYTWCGDFTFEGRSCFLALINEEYDLTYEIAGRKKKKKPIVKKTGLYYLWCCGTDDLQMERREMTLTEAMDLYGLIFDGVSRQELKDIGLMYG